MIKFSLISLEKNSHSYLNLLEKLMDWYKKATYSTELATLRDRLKDGFDPYDFSYLIIDYLEASDEMKEEWLKLEDYEVLEEWLKVATPKDKSSFQDYVANKMGPDPYGEPPYMHMDYKTLTKPDWLVHFTDDARDIEINGFRFGHPDMEGIHLTTYKRNRKKEPGYNFAFEVGSRNSKNVASDKKYGKQAVVFWGAGVEVFHFGDEERQIIVWGPSVNKSLIFAMYSDGHEWYVPGSNRDIIVLGDFEKVSTWITENYKMLIDIKNKSYGTKGKKPY